MGGELEVGGVELPLVLTVSEEGDGSLNATVDSPDQGAMGLKVDLIELNDDGVLRFEMKTLSAKFEGKRDELGKTIVGELTQAGTTLPSDERLAAPPSDVGLPTLGLVTTSYSTCPPSRADRKGPWRSSRPERRSSRSA